MSLASQGINAAWNSYVGALIRLVAQLGTQVMLLRLLGPDVIGTFGYFLLSYGILALVIDQGLGWAMTSRSFEDHDELAVALSRVLLAAALCALLTFALSYWIEAALDSPLVGTTLRYCAPAYFLVGMYVISHAQLRLSLRYREIQVSITAAYLIGYAVVGLTMGWLGFGVWSLVAAIYVQGLVQMSLMYSYTRHPLRLSNPIKSIACAGRATRVATINVVNWLVDNSGNIFIAPFGSFHLGTFNAASTVARTPVNQLVVTVQSVIFTLASTQADKRDSVVRMFLGILAVMSVVVFPLYAGLNAHSSLFVLIFFGEKWIHMAPTLSVLCIGMAAYATGSVSGTILTAIGDEHSVIRFQAITLIIMGTGMLIAVHTDQAYIAVTVSLAHVISACLQTGKLARVVGVSYICLWRAMRGGVGIGLLMLIPIPFLASIYPSAVEYESASLLIKLVAASILIVVFPKTIFAAPFLETLNRSSIGKKIASFLRIKDAAGMKHISE